MSFRALLEFGSLHWWFFVVAIPTTLVFIASFIFVIEQKRNNKWLKWLGLIATIILIISLVLYVVIVVGTFVEKFHQIGLQDGIDKWGQVGDFFGGMLNPILAFASFIALLYTIRIQSSQLALSRAELAETRLELARSAKAQEESGKALKDQYAAIEHQKFENRFFKLLELFESEKQRVLNQKFPISCLKVESRECVRPELSFTNFALMIAQGNGFFFAETDEHGSGPFQFDKTYTDSLSFARHIVIVRRHQFEQMFDLLMLILLEVKNRKKPKRYYIAVRTLLSRDILFLLAIWCSIENKNQIGERYETICSNHMKKYLSLRREIENSGLLRNLLIDEVGGISLHTDGFNIESLPYALTAYGHSHFIKTYKFNLDKKITS